VFKNTLSVDTFRGLKLVGKSKILPGAYLAGGTALALRLGHRRSVDLDFFTRKKFNEQIVVRRLKKLGKFKEKTVDWQTVMGSLFGVSFSLFYFEYPLVGKTDQFEGVAIASLKDIAAMKLRAIGDRGTKRDFVDLFFLAKEMRLAEVFQLYHKKFGGLTEQKYHLWRALNYFEDADKDVLPKMFRPVEWSQVKRFFNGEVKKLAAELKLTRG